MYTVIGFAIVGLMVGCTLYFRGRGGLAVAAGGVIGVIAGNAMAILICPYTPFQWEEEGTWELRAMVTTTKTSGTFVWGTGTINSETAYRVMIVNRDGSLSPLTFQATANNTKIFEKESLHDKGEITVSRLCRDRNWWLTGFTFAKPDSKRRSYKVTVPKGSVHNEFKVQ